MMKNISNLISASGSFNLDEALRAVAELHVPEGTLVKRCQEDNQPSDGQEAQPCQAA